MMATEPEEREYTCYRIINVNAYSAKDAALAAEDAMDNRSIGSVWHVVEGIEPVPAGAVEIDTWGGT